MSKTSTKSLRFDGFYHKQGDDLNHHLQDKKPLEALLAWADQLENAAASVRKLVEVVKKSGEKLSIDADCHCVWLRGLSDVTVAKVVKIPGAELETAEESEAS